MKTRDMRKVSYYNTLLRNSCQFLTISFPNANPIQRGRELYAFCVMFDACAIIYICKNIYKRKRSSRNASNDFTLSDRDCLADADCFGNTGTARANPV